MAQFTVNENARPLETVSQENQTIVHQRKRGVVRAPSSERPVVAAEAFSSAALTRGGTKIANKKSKANARRMMKRLFTSDLRGDPRGP